MIDQVRVMKRIRTQTKGTKPLEYGGGNTLAIYTFLADVEYQVQAHFEWNLAQPDLEPDRVEGKHFAIAQRMLDRGGRQDIFLGTRDCQGYVEPCEFGSGPGELDGAGELGFGLMFHGFDYPDETGDHKLHARFWTPRLTDGLLRFPRPEECTVRKFVREMSPKRFGLGVNVKPVATDADEWEA
jgi:CRISPR-associated protein Cas5d